MRYAVKDEVRMVETVFENHVLVRFFNQLHRTFSFLGTFIKNHNSSQDMQSLPYFSQ